MSSCLDGESKVYCLKCKGITETNDITHTFSKNNRKMMKGKCKICKTVKCKFVTNNREATISGVNAHVGGEINENVTKCNDLKETYYNTKTGYCGINEL